MADDLGPVYIGAREIYDAVVRLQTSVDRLADQVVTLSRETQDHETRIRSLEKSRWPLPSVSILLSLLAAGITLITFLQR